MQNKSENEVKCSVVGAHSFIQIDMQNHHNSYSLSRIRKKHTQTVATTHSIAVQESGCRHQWITFMFIYFEHIRPHCFSIYLYI